MRTSEQETLNVNLMDGGIMDEATLEKIARYEQDVENLNDQITAANAAQEVMAQNRRFFSNRVGALEFEKCCILDNIRRLKLGLPEREWREFEDDPSDYADFTH